MHVLECVRTFVLECVRLCWSVYVCARVCICECKVCVQLQAEESSTIG